MIGRLVGIVIDCPDPRALATFYEAVLGAERVEDSADWVTLAVDGGNPTFSFQRTDRFRAPDWTSGEPPQQLHLDILVDNLDDAEGRVLALAARSWTVLTSPSASGSVPIRLDIPSAWSHPKVSRDPTPRSLSSLADAGTTEALASLILRQ